MGRLTEKAERLVAEFKKRIETLPESERDEVIKKMTESISALNEDLKAAYNKLRGTKTATPEETDTIDNVSEFL